MRQKLAARAFGFLPLALLVGTSCSLVYDLSPDQCGTAADCLHFGPGLTCDDGVCVCADPNNCQAAAGKGGQGGSTGGTNNGGKGGVSAMGGDAGTPDTGGTTSGGTGGSTGGTSGGKGGKGGGTNGGTGGSTSDAGTGGMEPEPECETHADCADLYDDFETYPRACVKKTHKCVLLKTDDCPIVLPLSDNGVYNTLKSSDAIILGGFASIPSSVVGRISLNYDLAISELSDELGGVKAGSSKRHELVMVVCNFDYDTQAELLVPARHLMEDLDVKGVVSELFIEDQRYVFEQVAQENGVFMMMPLYSDQALINLEDDGLVWHILSGADSLSVTIQPLVDATRTHLENLDSTSVGSTHPLEEGEDMKVALINAADERFLNDMSTYFKNEVYFNKDANGDRKLAKDNDESHFTVINVDSSYTDPNDAQEDAINAILDFKPHVVFGSTATEMLTKIIPGIESNWDNATNDDGIHTAGLDRPFYLLSPLDYNLPEMDTMIRNTPVAPGKVPLYQRILGINWPSAENPQLYTDYYLRFKAANPGVDAPHYENFYDAAYYLMYAVAAATQPLTGRSIAAGMQRLITGSMSAPVGPDALDANVSFLDSSANAKFKLIGTMGPPNWDTNGGRTDAASVWCINADRTYASDVQRYDNGTLTQAVSCFPFPAPATP